MTKEKLEKALTLKRTISKSRLVMDTITHRYQRKPFLKLNTLPCGEEIYLNDILTENDLDLIMTMILEQARHVNQEAEKEFKEL